MSEEEKEAIEWLKKHILVNTDKNGKIIIYNDTLLNLIEKLQKEIEEYKELVECIEEFKRLKRPVIEIVHEMNKFEDEFISKDKIRENKKWYEDTCQHLLKDGMDLDRYDRYQGIIDFCNYLLKENEK